ncbi:hypothetical protein PoB_003739600 [Plakobranchus ocellatus]|uniref:Uncharacterized protein n=1 Tax=Plakobranchus ocellatus TaxID=259542 RepID=A0AAV4AWI9_9GAST|nr:hypothetical protein PoB_003739600 [Plakobranchus ocellatus]
MSCVWSALAECLTSCVDSGRRSGSERRLSRRGTTTSSSQSDAGRADYSKVPTDLSSNKRAVFSIQGGPEEEEMDENDEIELMFGSFDEMDLDRSLKKSRSQLGVNLIHERALTRDPAGGGGRFSFSKR